MVALPPVCSVKESGALKSRFSGLPSSLRRGTVLPSMVLVLSVSSSRVPGSEARKMWPSPTAWPLTVLLNSSTVLVTPLSSFATLWAARSSSMREVDTVMAATSMAMMTLARVKLMALMRVPTLQLAG